jgi:serine/threonine protein kinase
MKQVLDDRYEIRETIKSGGFGVVSRGYDTQMERSIVIKALHSHLTDEAMISAQLIHPNIVQVYNFLSTPENRFYLVMELVDGKDLERILTRLSETGQRMNPFLVAYIGSCIAKALDYAHTKRETTTRKDMKIVHRDVTPGNVLVSYEGRVKLSDFGIMKAATRQAEKTQVGAIKGKYRYMSPEQARGEEVDRRTDIYALGISMYEAATGEKPFKDGSDYNILLNVSKGEFDTERKNLAKRGIPQKLTSVIHKCTEKHLKKRYQSAREVFLALEDYMSSSDQLVDEAMLSRLMTELYAKQKKAVGTEETLVISRSPEPVRDTEDVSSAPKRVSPGWKRSRTLVVGLVCVIGFGSALLGFDVFRWHKTGFGRGIHDRVNPPDAIISSVPEGEILYLDERQTGPTPCLISGISPGLHLVRLGSSSAGAAREIHVKSKIDAGDNTQQILISLKTELSIVTIPAGAAIHKDGIEFGTTPASVRIEAKDIRITLSRKGFEPLDCAVNLANLDDSTASDGLDSRFCVLDSDSSGTKRLVVRLPKKVNIVVKPPNGVLKIDGKLVSDRETLIPAGDHLVRMEMKGYEPIEKKMYVDENTHDIRITLHRYVTIAAKDRSTGKKITDFTVKVTASGRHLGTFKGPRISLPGETCKLTFRSKGYESSSYSLSPDVFSKVAKLRSGEPGVVIEVVDAKTGAFVPGATVWYSPDRMKEPVLSGRTSAGKPYSLAASQGYCLIRVTASDQGYKEAIVEKQIIRGETGTIRIALKKRQ